MKYVKLKSTHGDSCHHIEEPGVGWKYADGNTVHHFEPGRL
ncbi:hypothetical protein [Bacillus wiedmannii]